ncbi:MAG: arylsulfatase [Verrucomicrobia bacterium]|jgi:arylsulfatase|nr:MAG: arylsulfatase [Verrucomicrobiota bacterium]
MNFITAARLALCIALVIGTCGQAPGATRPNIVIILSDDMGWGDLGCYGGEIRTPNLDKLASKGLRFTQFYNTGRCCPTRAALMTGLYSHQAGVGHMTSNRGYRGYQGELNNRCVTIAEVLRPAGYSTYGVGKWHLALNTKDDGEKYNWPLQRGFDHHYGIISGGSHYFHAKNLERDNKSFTWDTDPEYKPERFYLTDAFTDHAVKYVTDHAREQNEKPFFLYLAYTAAHWPIHAFEEDINAYNGFYDAGYEAIRMARRENQIKLGLTDSHWTLSPTIGDWEKFPAQKWESRMMQAYAAMVTRMDAGIGKLVATLEKNGQLDNTIVMFLQDNGACAEPVAHEDDASYEKNPGAPDTYLGYGKNWANVGNTPFRYYKHYEHEGGISTPLIVHWPKGIPASQHNQLVRDPGHLIDLMPTCVEVAGAKYPSKFNGTKIQHMEGLSLAPTFTGIKIKRKSPIFFEHEGNRAVRDGNWKLASSFKPNGSAWELYDMEKDRTEMHDLATRNPAKAKKMANQWDQWSKRVGVQPWPIKSPGIRTNLPSNTTGRSSL